MSAAVVSNAGGGASSSALDDDPTTSSNPTSNYSAFQQQQQSQQQGDENIQNAASTGGNNNTSNSPQPDALTAAQIRPIDTTDVIASCENIHKTYLLGIEGVPALRGVSADVYRRDFLVIYGTSGGGKSTLLNVFGTIDVPTKGNLSLFSHRITERTPDEYMALLRCRKVGFVFQSFNLLSTMSALDNVALPMIIAGDKSADDIEARATQLLRSVGLGHRLTHMPSQLSGGEQQRVTIARALANEPDVLLLDEPTGDLDTKSTHVVMNILLSLNCVKGLTMMMVTHDVYMKRYATRVLHLRDGRVAREEGVDHAARVESILELQDTVEVEMRQTRERLEKPATYVQETRRPQDYATFSPRASQRTFYRHEHPVLFEELFGSNRERRVGGGDGVGDGGGGGGNQQNPIQVQVPIVVQADSSADSGVGGDENVRPVATSSSVVVGNGRHRPARGDDEGARAQEMSNRM